MTRGVIRAVVVFVLLLSFSLSSFSASARTPVALSLGSVLVAASVPNQDDAVRHIIENAAAERLAADGRYRIDLTVSRTENDGVVRYDVRAVIVEKKTSHLRHTVHAAASAHLTNSKWRNSKLETQVAKAAADHAISEALTISGMKSVN